MPSKSFICLGLALFGSILSPMVLMAQTTGPDSRLWSEFQSAGIKNDKVTLPDFSYAGYHQGRDPIPGGGKIFSVNDYGALPDDLLDDAKAIQKTIDAAAKNRGGVVFFPRGRYLVNTSMSHRKSIQITNSGIVLRGEGATNGGTVIHQIHPFDSGVPGTDPRHYHLGESVFTIRSVAEDVPFSSKSNLTLVTGYSNADPFSIEVARTDGLAAGQNVLLYTENSDLLLSMIAPYEADPEWGNLFKKPTVVEIHRIQSIAGSRIVFFEPVRYAVRPNDGWVLKPFRPLTEVGVEDIAFMGNAWHRYVHHRSDVDDSGWSFVKMKGVSDSWVRRCAFLNTSQTLSITLSSYVSAVNLLISGNQGHHIPRVNWFCYGVLAGLIADRANYSHGPSVSQGSVGTVFWRWELGPEQPIDCHAGRPFATLFDRIDGGSLYGSTGGLRDFPQHLKKLVIWNFKHGVKADPASPRVYDFWKKGYGDVFVNPIISGFHGEKASFNEAHLEVLESLGSPVSPESLFEAQLGLRLGKMPEWIPAARREHKELLSSALPDHYQRNVADSRPFLVPEKFSVKSFLDFVTARGLQMNGKKLFTHSFDRSDLSLTADQNLVRHAVYAAMVAVYSLSQDGNMISVQEALLNGRKSLIFRIASAVKKFPGTGGLEDNPDFKDAGIYLKHLNGTASLQKNKEGVSIEISLPVESP